MTDAYPTEITRRQKSKTSPKSTKVARTLSRIASGARSLETHGEAPVGRCRFAPALTNRRATEEVPPQISVCTAIWQPVAVHAQLFGAVSIPEMTCRSGKMTLRLLEWVWMDGERRLMFGTNATLWCWTLAPEIWAAACCAHLAKVGKCLDDCHRQRGHFPSTIMKRSCGTVVHFVSLLPSTEVLKKCRPWSLHRA